MIDLGTVRGIIQVDGMNDTIEGLGNVQSQSDNVGKNLDKIGKVIKTSFLAVSAAVVGVSVAAVKKFDEFKQALNGLAAQTGATEEELNGLHDSLLNIYSQNYGEDYEDIANSLASVKQQTNLTGEALENATINAIALRDTFDWEVDESIRAADMMMKQFGLSSDEAYNLLAQGAQNGLDKNQNLLDSVNEYSVHFNQLGFSAEEMFNMFANGAESGVFDIDKLGDAVKEFGIRAQDGSNTSIEAFEALGFNAEEMQEKFSQGGQVAKDAFDEVNQALINCDDRVVQNTAGVNLYGTMFEDLGIEAIAAMSQIDGSIDATANTLERIKEIKYDDFGSAMAGIGRQLETGLLIPIGEMLLPYLNEFANWISEHMPEIQAVCEVVISVIGKAIEIIADVVGAIITGVQSLYEGFNEVSNQNGEIGQELTETWSTISTFLSTTFSQITELVSMFVDAVKEFWENHGETIMNIVKPAWETMQAVITTVLQAISDILNIWIAVFKGDWEGAWEGIKTYVTNLWENLYNVFSNWLDYLINLILGWGEILYSASEAAFEYFASGIKYALNAAVEWIVDKFNNIVDTILGFGRLLYDAGVNIFTNLWDGLKDTWENVKTWIEDKVDWLKDKLTFWNNNKSKVTTDNLIDGSHANGLGYVPYDGYIAELHKGEMVLTEREASNYNNITQDSGNQVTNNYYNTIDASSVSEFNDIVDMCNNYRMTARMG